VHGAHSWRSARSGDSPEQRRLRRLVVGYWDGGVWVDGEERACWRCGLPGRPGDQLGHVIAAADGGETVRGNVHREHAACNLAAGRALGRERLMERARGGRA
jgi:hypothetical protein